MDERWGKNALGTQEFQCLINQWDRAVAFHRMDQQLAGKPEILSPSALPQRIGSPNLIEVFIESMLSFPILSKSGRWDLHLVSNHRENTRGNTCQIFQRASRVAYHGKLNSKAKTIMWSPPLIDEVQILLREGLVAGDFSVRQISRDLHQCMTLFRGQIRRFF